MITLFFGGDTNVGRRIHLIEKNSSSLISVEEMSSAHVRLINLECVIATKGEQGLKFRHRRGPFYIHARPEQTNILVNADIDIVLTANNHAGDYGRAALLEQNEILDRAGILHAGSGKNLQEALNPIYKKVGDVTLAIFSVDSTYKAYSASSVRAGTAYVSAKHCEEMLASRIRVAHEKADVVIVAPHWGKNYSRKPTSVQQNFAHQLIELGADAVLGCHAHRIQGVENYKNRPIIYDAGDFFFDRKRKIGYGCFTLDISSNGVEKVNFIPLIIDCGQTLRANGEQAQKNNEIFIKLCNEFNTTTTISERDSVEIKFNPPPRQSKIINDVAIAEQEKHLIAPITEPRPEWTADKVPDEAIIPPKKFGDLKLVGYYVPPKCRTMTEIRTIYVETYWTIDKPTDKSCILSITGVPVRECDMPPYGGQDLCHEFCDHMWPTNRWKPGVIYREKFGLHSPNLEYIVNTDLRIKIAVTAGNELLGEFEAPDLIRIKISNLPRYNTDFDDIIYQSELGKCWTAEQLEKVTGGKWIVPPPKGWYVNSFSRSDALVNVFNQRPTLFLSNTIKGKDSHERILRNVSKLDGALVSHDVKGLPPDFPLLKVEVANRAMYEIAFAARKRFQGKVIAVTGSSGKTTTCNMLSCVLGKGHNIKANLSGTNLYQTIPWVFASVNQNDAYAIIEMAASAFIKPPGSITYEITPNVAVVTSLAPAHVSYKVHGSLENVARYKSRIFCGMTPGSYAILNRDMPHYEIFEKRAKSFKLNIITFGTHPDATIRMPALENGGKFFIGENVYKLSCPVPHDQLYDALAVVGVSVAIGFSIEKTLEYLKGFEVVQGRGNTLNVVRGGKKLTIIDSAFNANPLSMKYALEHLKATESNKKSRVAILGDMAELGADTAAYHKELAEPLIAAEPDRVLLCGEIMRNLYDAVKDKVNVIYFATLADLLKNVETHLRDGDTVLLKSSHATGLAKVVALLSE